MDIPRESLTAKFTGSPGGDFYEVRAAAPWLQGRLSDCASSLVLPLVNRQFSRLRGRLHSPYCSAPFQFLHFMCPSSECHSRNAQKDSSSALGMTMTGSSSHLPADMPDDSNHSSEHEHRPSERF
jgi:hypothetical protein